ncbi:RND efflux system, outer membrane lipoprotein CmeC [Acinetobacter sp. neg1]|uniref:efflux transporter outer membrane subunit n=1 Tax=Acinetobacter TaxID=469 RepID=UPI0005420387|nr:MULTISPECIES: efflux transporter outer membrane subunit [Acinetobacter]KHF78563.1 RND efflux system, outer membrane lipoprotein CmeC [Acinetobacter sp. neg1]MBJ8482474.1 efflux transporter outer membrane subunit [Acinetobacter vivianii]
MTGFKPHWILSSLMGSLLLAGCSLAPEYQPAKVIIPLQFKEADAKLDDPNWSIAQPADAQSRGEWWHIFNDPQLNDLQQQAIVGNQNLKAAAANIQASRALRSAAQAERLPSIGAGFGPTRQKPSPASLGLDADTPTSARTLWRAQANVSYELDLFGRIASSVNAATADVQQQEALYHSALLALQADVAQAYFLIRQFDAEQAIYAQNIKLLTENQNLIQARYRNGLVSDLDVSRAQTELSTAQTNALSIARSRASTEHGLAVLLGKSPADFSLAIQPLSATAIRLPAGLPSSLLERRPDIAAAERAMAADNARIGIARAAFFPKLDLTGALGYESASLGNLGKWSSRTFLLGPLAGTILSLPLFDGGQRKAGIAQARAGYEQSVANYRQTVLNAFREVENGLSDQRILDQQIQAQGQALASSRHANQLSHFRYREGRISYLDVIDSDRNILQQEQLAAQLHGRRMIASVDLIRALGGGWHSQ